MRFIIAVLAPAIILLSGCGERSTAVSPASPRSSLPLYKIGLIPEQNIFAQKELYTILLDELGKRLKVQFESRILPSYGAVMKEFREETISGAFLGSLLSVMVLKNFPTHVLACPVYWDGSSTYTGVIITRKGSGVTKDISTWKGRSMALVHRNTTAGYIYPLYVLQRAGIKDFKSYLGRARILGSHDAVFYAVLEGHDDLGAMKSTIFNRIAAKSPETKEELVILSESKEVPANSLVVRNSLPDSLVTRLKEELLRLHESPEGREVLRKLDMQKFVPVSPVDYKNVTELIDALNPKDRPDFESD